MRQNNLKTPQRYRAALTFFAAIRLRNGSRVLALLLRALQLGNASQVAPIDKSSVVLVAISARSPRRKPDGAELAGRAAVAIGGILVALR